MQLCALSPADPEGVHGALAGGRSGHPRTVDRRHRQGWARGTGGAMRRAHGRHFERDYSRLGPQQHRRFQYRRHRRRRALHHRRQGILPAHLCWHVLERGRARIPRVRMGPDRCQALYGRRAARMGLCRWHRHENGSDLPLARCAQGSCAKGPEAVADVRRSARTALDRFSRRLFEHEPAVPFPDPVEQRLGRAGRRLRGRRIRVAPNRLAVEPDPLQVEHVHRAHLKKAIVKAV